jgi:hypothetical protein
MKMGFFDSLAVKIVFFLIVLLIIWFLIGKFLGWIPNPLGLIGATGGLASTAGKGFLKGGKWTGEKIADGGKHVGGKIKDALGGLLQDDVENDEQLQ